MSPAHPPPTSERPPEDLFAESEERSRVVPAVARAVAGLGAREKRIAEARWLADEPTTLEQLGVELGVSRERVRQLEQRAREQLASALESYRGAARAVIVARESFDRPLARLHSTPGNRGPGRANE